MATKCGCENFFMISASCKNASGDIVFGLSVLTATSTRPCHVPIVCKQMQTPWNINKQLTRLPFQTSPKLPAPSFLIRVIWDRGISYWSRVAYSKAFDRPSLGCGFWHGFVSWQHSPENINNQLFVYKQMHTLFTFASRALVASDKVLQGGERLSGGNEIAPVVVKRFDLVMFHMVETLLVIILDAESKSSWILFGLPHQERAFSICVSHQQIFGFPPTNRAKIPTENRSWRRILWC